MGQTTAAGTRCPRCSAAVRPGAPWCTQCYVPLSAADAPAPAADLERRPVPTLAVRAPEPAAPTEPGPVSELAPGRELQAGLPAGTWPCTACAQPNDLALEACAGCGTPFLAAVRGARPTVVLPVVGDLLALSPVRRTVLAVGVVVAFLVVVALLALLLA